MRLRKTWGGLLAVVVLLLMAVPAGAGGGWHEGVPYDGGPGCDFNENGVSDGYLNPEIPYEYRLAGKLKGDTLSGRYTQRFTNVAYGQNEDPPSGEVPEVILVTGTVTFIGELRSDDFSDVAQLEPVGDEAALKWSYTITDVNGGYLAVAGGTINLDFTTGDVTFSGTYGPCQEP